MADKTISLTAATATAIDPTDLLARLRVELHDEDSNNFRWTSDRCAASSVAVRSGGCRVVAGWLANPAAARDGRGDAGAAGGSLS